MVHHQQLRDELIEYVNCSKIPVQVGKEMFIVHHCYFNRKAYQRNDYQLRLLDPGQLNKFDTDYYETYGTFRPLDASNHSFAFHLNFMNNLKLIFYKNPPGESILDPLEQLLIFTSYCFEGEQFDALEALINQFPVKYNIQQTQIYQKDSWKKFASRFDSLIGQNYDTLNQFIGHILRVHSLLPLKVNNLYGFIMNHNPIVINVGEMYFVREELVDQNDTEESVVNNNLATIKGYILHLIFNKIQQKEDWIKAINTFAQQQPLLFRPIVKHLLFYFVSNDQRLTQEQFQYLQKLIDDGLHGHCFQLEAVIELKTILLDFTMCTEDFFFFLSEVYGLIKEFKDSEQIYNNQANVIYEKRIMIYQLKAALENYMKEGLQTIEYQVNFLYLLKGYSEEIKEMIQLSTFPFTLEACVLKHCNQANAKLISLELLREIFVTLYKPGLLNNPFTLFEQVVDILLSAKVNKGFRPVFMMLLMDWDQRDLNYNKVTEWIKFKADRQNDISLLIKQYDVFISDIKKICATSMKNHSEFLSYVAKQCVEFIIGKVQASGQNLTDYLSQLDQCNSQLLQNQYAQKLNQLMQKDNDQLQSCYNLRNLMPKLIAHKQQRENLSKQSKIAEIIIDFQNFNKLPTVNEVRYTLINNASIDHTWYRVLSQYDYHNTQEIARHLALTLRSFTLKVVHRELILEEIISIKNQALEVREALVKYLIKTVEINLIKNLNNFDFAEHLQIIIAETDNKISQFQQLRDFFIIFLKLQDDHVLLQCLNRNSHEYLKKTLIEVQLFEELKPYMEQANKVLFLKDSIVFKKQLQEEQNLEGAGNIKGLINACERSYNYLLNRIQQFLSSSIDTYKAVHIKYYLMANERLHPKQIKNEIEYFKRLSNANNHADILMFEFLEKSMLAISEQEVLHQQSLSIISIATMVHLPSQVQKRQMKRNNLPSEEQIKIFKVNFDSQLREAQTFIEKCVTNFNTVSAEDYLESSRTAQEQLLKTLNARNQGEEYKILSNFQKLGFSIELFQFLCRVKTCGLEFLKDYVTNFNEGKILTQTINNFIIISDFLNDMNRQYPLGLSYHEFITFIKEGMMQEQYRSLADIITNCLIQLPLLIDLKNTLEGKGDSKKEHILQIIECCHYSFELKQDQWELELAYVNNNREYKFNIENLLELSHHAFLMKSTFNYELKRENSMILNNDQENKQEEDLRAINKYIQFINSISSIIQNLDLLFQFGYPDIGQTFQCKLQSRNSDFDNLKALGTNVEDKLQKWQKDLVHGYSSYNLLTFIDCKNFWLVEQYLLKKPLENQMEKQALNILKFMGKNYDSLRFNFQESQNIDPEQRLLHLGNMLDQLENRVKLNIIELMPAESSAKIQQNTGELIYMDQINPIVGILSIFTNTERPFPRSDQLFFCNEMSSWPEIYSFLYRCAKSQYQELHLMIKPERLNLEYHVKLTQLISQLVEKEMCELPFFFGIITAEPSSYVSQTIRQQNYTRILKCSNILQEQQIAQTIKRIDYKSKLVRSSYSGLGKTFYIKRVAKQEGKELHLFPISGEISYELIGSRLAELEFHHDVPSIICLQVNSVNNLSLLNEMIANLALFKILKSPKGIFIQPENCEMWIELANTVDDSAIKQVFYFQNIKTHMIDKFSVKDLEFNNQEPLKDPTINVCANLQMFKDQSIISNNPNDEFLLQISQNKQQCIQLLEQYFIEQQKEFQHEPNYIQLKIFIHILSSMFKNFKQSNFFYPEEVQQSIQELRQTPPAPIMPTFETIRYSIVEAMLITVKEQTKLVNRELCLTQSQVQNQIKISEIEVNLDMDQECILEEEEPKYQVFACSQNGYASNLARKVSWENLNHFNIVMVEDGSIMLIYKDQENVPEGLKKLIFLQENTFQDISKLKQQINGGSFQIEDIAKMNSRQLSSKLQLLRSSNHHYQMGKQDYVVTTDNFLKLCTIYQRVQSHVPVIIMGDTGCGKTALIKYLCKNVLRESFEVFNIQAGVTYQMIVNKMRALIAVANDLHQQKLWILFDEFNTTVNIDLICEILCERQLQGERIPDNICLLAAGNHFKLKLKNINIEQNNFVKHSNKSFGYSQLHYQVHPLPDSAIDYVLNFGALSEQEYEGYIEQMLYEARATMDKEDEIYQLELSTAHRKKTINLMQRILICSHKYFIMEEEASSVSLRDVVRFNKLFKWFKRSLITRRQILQSKRPHTDLYIRNKTKYNVKTKIGIEDTELELRANILALCHCYYLRISKNEQRERFLETICQIATNSEPYQVTPQIIKDIVSEEQNDYLCRMELSQSIAVNQALKENIYGLIPCIMCKIPLIIQGKSGCSKSLALQLIFANLRGHKSVDKYFQTLKEITMFPVQGSLSCTSGDIQAAYSQAVEYLKINQTSIPVFVFDQIGHAELSKLNPLQVLHSELDKQNSKIAFISLSYWRLNASIMNRFLILYIPEPDEQDLIFTALSIFRSICPLVRNKDELIKNLARTYFELKAYYKRNEPQFTDFYGLRDFYHLIKQVSNFITTGNYINDDEVLEFVKTAIQRNFGGKMHAVEKFGHLFMRKQKVEDKYPHIPNKTTLELIEMNFLDKDSRFLMVICKPDIAAYLIEREFKKLGKDKVTIVGSNLYHDVQSEKSSFQALRDIIHYAQKGISIILQDMDRIYCSLQDLFNQNYSKFCEKYYCRITLEPLILSQCYVHDDFRCVIFMRVDDQSLSCADPSFINKFEKQYIKIQYLLNEKQRTIVDLIHDWVQKLLTLNFRSNRNLENCLKPTSIFPNYSNEQIGLLVLKKDDGIISASILFKECIEEMISYSSEDILLACQNSALDNEEIKDILCIYQDMNQVTFKKFISDKIWQDPNLFLQPQEEEEKKHNLEDGDEMNQKSLNNTMQRQPLKPLMRQIENQPKFENKIVAFTYSIVLVDLPRTKHINISNWSNFNSESEVAKHLQDFYQSSQEQVLIIEVNYQKDKHYIHYIKYIIEKIENQILKEKLILKENDQRNPTFGKTVILLIHLLRNDHEYDSSMLPTFDGWTLKMFQDISSEKKPFLLVKNIGILSKNIIEIIEEERLIEFDNVINNLAERCLMNLVFEGDNGDVTDNEQIGQEIKNNQAFIISKMCKDNQLVQAFKSKIFDAIQNERSQSDWTLAVCCNKDIFSQSPNIADAIKRVIEARIEKHLNSIFYLLENNYAFRTYFTDELDDDYSDKIKEIWIAIFNSPSLSIKQIQLQNISQNLYTRFVSNLRFPFSRLEYDILQQLKQNQQEIEWSSGQMIGRTGLDNFKDIFISRSIVTNMIEQFPSYPQIQRLYIEDMIKIFLIDNMLNIEYSTTIQLILNKVRTLDNDFFSNVYTFLMKQEIFIVLCNILEIYHQIRGAQASPDETRSMIGQLFDKYQAKGEQEAKEIVVDIKDIVADVVDQLAADIYPNEENLLLVQKGINIMNQLNIPHNEVTIVGQTLAAYSILVEKILRMVFKIESSGKVQKIKVLRFWIDFANILSRHASNATQEDKAHEAIGLIINSARHASSIEIEAPPLQLLNPGCLRIADEEEELKQPVEHQKKQFLDNDDFVSYIVDYFSDKQDEHSMYYFSSFLSLLLTSNSKYIATINKVCTAFGDKFYRYTSQLFTQQINLAEIRETIQNYQFQINQAAGGEVYQDLLLQQDNGFYIEFEKILASNGFTCKYAIALSDALIKIGLEDKDKTLINMHYPFRNYLKIVYRDDIPQDEFPHTQKLIALSMIKAFLNIYAQYLYNLHNPNPRPGEEYTQLTFEEEYVQRLVDESIIHSPMKFTLQVYIMKRLRQLLGYNKNQLKQFIEERLKNHDYQWVDELDFGAGNAEGEGAQGVEMVPSIESIKDEEMQIQAYIKNICKNNDPNSKVQVKRFLQACNTPKKKLTAGLAFLKAVYVRYAIQGVVVNYNLITFFEQELQQDILDIVLGVEYSQLIGLLIQNFPFNNFLKMEPSQNQDKIQQQIISCYALIFLLSFKGQQNALSGQFFRNGEFSIQTFKDSFLIGLEMEPKHQYIQNVMINYHSLKFDTWKAYGGRYAKGSCYKCGNPQANGRECEYVYFVSNCGGQVEQQICPWCHAIIGGLNNRIHQRPGHSNLTDEEAKEYIQQVNERYTHQQRPSYSPVSVSEQNSSLSYFNLHPVTWRFFRLFLHLPLYLMNTTNLANEEQLKDAFSEFSRQPHPLTEIGKTPFQFLDHHIKNDLKMLFAQLSAYGNDVAAPWIYYIFSKFFDFMDGNNGADPTTANVRDSFQRTINDDLIAPNIAIIPQLSQDYKKKLIDNANLIDQLLEETIAVAENAPYLEYFRMTSEISFEGMKAAFFNSPMNSQQYKIMKIGFDYFEDIKKLRKFHTIIDYTSSLLPLFNHQLTRQEARTKTIKDAFEYIGINWVFEAQPLFERFVNAWNNVGFENIIQYDCHRLTYQRYDAESPIISILLDNREAGIATGMCMGAGWQELSKLQNKILKELQDAYIQEMKIQGDLVFDATEYPVQTLKQEHILDVKLDSDDLLKSCAMNNITYGEGQEIIYDFARFQQNLIIDIVTRKLVRYDRMEFIQYQMELLTLNGEKCALINDIRKKYKQSPISEHTKELIDQQLDYIARGDAQSLKELHGGIEKIMFFLQNARVDSEDSIESFCNNLPGRLTPQFKERTTISDVQIKNIVHLFETIEISYFPKIVPTIREEFKNHEKRAEIRSYFNTLFETQIDQGLGNLPSRQQIQLAIMRFIIRCLAAQLEPTHQLGLYLFRSDFWEEPNEHNDIENKIDHLEQVFKQDILLNNVECTYQVIDELNMEKDHRRMAPQLEEQKNYNEPGNKKQIIQRKLANIRRIQ